MITNMRDVVMAMMIIVVSSAPSLSNESTFQQAQNAYDAADYQKAEATWRKSAEEGDLESMFALGTLLLEGPGDLPVNEVESSEWFLKAAELGHPESQYNIGNAYQKGLGVKQDDVQATRWWQRAAAQGVPNAAYNLGVQYMYGRGVPQDYEQALKMFQFAAARNHLSARKLLRAWHFEIPELAGTEPGDVDKLAGLFGDTENDSTTDSGERLASAAEVPGSESGGYEPGTEVAEGQVTIVTVDPSVSETLEPEEESVLLPESQSSIADIAVVSVKPEAEAPSIVAPETEAGAAEVSTESGSGAINASEQLATADTLATLTTSEARILGFPPKHYTLQLTAMSNSGLVDDFIRQFQLTGELYRYRYTRGSSILYGLSIGNFDSREAAIALSTRLAGSVQDKRNWQNPWLRKFGDIQKLILTMQETSQ